MISLSTSRRSVQFVSCSSVAVHISPPICWLFTYNIKPFYIFQKYIFICGWGTFKRHKLQFRKPVVFRTLENIQIWPCEYFFQATIHEKIKITKGKRLQRLNRNKAQTGYMCHIITFSTSLPCQANYSLAGIHYTLFDIYPMNWWHKVVICVS